jgi:hypothetical protein
MVDLTRDADGTVRARLLDLVPGRTGAAYRDWLAARTEAFRTGVAVATLDPFHGYKNAIDDQLDDAVAVLDAFHVIKLGTDAVETSAAVASSRTSMATAAARATPLYGIRLILRCGQTRPTSREPGWTGRSPPTRATTRSTSPGNARNSCARPTRPRRWPRDARSPRRSWPRSRAARSPRSPGSAAPSTSGRRRSWPTSTPAARTTAAQRRSTASSNSTDASPAASATATTTGYACCSSAADSIARPTASKKSRMTPSAAN